VDATSFSQYSTVSRPTINHRPGVSSGFSNAGGPTLGNSCLADGRTPERVPSSIAWAAATTTRMITAPHLLHVLAEARSRWLRDKTHAEVYEFYMDIAAPSARATEEFYERVQEEGVVMVRGRGAEVQVLPEGKLRVTARMLTWAGWWPWTWIWWC